jgi:5-methylcytosine-specific restriction endonuclease McrA
VCQICSLKVDRRLSHPDPGCGSLDHVVPLAAGGTNDLANIQLTHLHCNLAKGARGTDQLRLFS